MIIFACVQCLSAQNKVLQPPVAPVIEKVDTVHNTIRVDDYFWLRDRNDPRVIEYLESWNYYTDVVMQDTKAFQKILYEEMLGRIKETDLSVPERIDDYYYYSRTEEGRQYPIYCRKHGSLDAEEEVMLDHNVLAQEHDYCEIAVLEVSPNHELLIYSVDTIGDERYTLYIKNLGNDTLFHETIENCGYSVAWANDNQTFFYTILDKAKRPYKLYRHVSGTDPQNDRAVFTEDDDRFWLYISRTKSGTYLVIDIGSHTTTETHILAADTPMDPFQLFAPRRDQVEYYVEHNNGYFYILTNDDAPNFKIMQTSTETFQTEPWETYIPHNDSVKIESFDMFRDYLVTYERIDGLEHIKISDLLTRTSHYIDFPEPVYTYWRHPNREFDAEHVRYTYSSLITPRTVYDYNMTTRHAIMKKQYEVMGGYDKNLYCTERFFAFAPDSTRVPVSLVYREGMLKNGTNNIIMEGYGAYGSSMDTYFSSNRLSLLDRGCIYAIAHIRGGGEMGRYWYDQGKLLKKMNTFTDFLACAEHLIKEGYTSPDHIAITGGSAGGLLIGAVLNMKPQLFHTAIADVPFVDLMNTMLDPTLPLTVCEYEEWGDPGDKEYYDYMIQYSPYDNVTAQEYPHILITAGLNDTRVMYWEAAKWAAKLRALKTDNNILLLKTKMDSGHLGSSGRYDFLKDIAFEYAFILSRFGIYK
ncbi:S9 family peptidase [candidate division WOR-3 bacterium]|nr:S9 family peptidase [candidate division WOR-3 bacterium]